MKIAIIFDSRTGNTAQIAGAIREACANETIIAFGSPADVSDADLIFAGSWTDKGNFAAPILAFLEGLCGKKAAFFGTAGYGGAREYTDSLAARAVSHLPDGCTVLGSFYCLGKMPPSVRERYVSMLREHPEDQKLPVSIQSFDSALSHPDTRDLQNAKAFALKMLDAAR